MLKLMIRSVDERSPSGIAGAISRLIRNGKLERGARMPTVREFAAALGTSPTTVSQAWALLTRAGLITPQGRRGTFVAEQQSPRGVWRVRRTMGSPGRPALDLSTGTPDLDLLPDLATALARVVPTDHTRDYYDDPVISELDDKLRERWPYDPPQLTVVDGAMDALDRLVRERIQLGSPVLVENPAYPPLLDLLELAGAQLIALDLDEHGVTPESLRAGLTREPAAVFLQPRAQNPTGASMTTARAKQLAALLKRSPALVVEDDHCGDIALGPAISLGSWLPGSTVHIQSFSKSYGPDLRLAALSGPPDLVSALVDRRLLGPGWSSRLLQATLLELLRDPVVLTVVARARETYATRRQEFVAALARCGVDASAGDGINTWVAVRDEQTTLLAMAANGVGVAAGSPFTIQPLGSDHVRVTSGLIRTGHRRIAELLAESTATRPLRSSRGH